jgi:hypothetical protein
MGEPEMQIGEDQVAVVPVDAERGLALVLGAEVIDAESWQMPKGMIAKAIHVGGLLGGVSASKALLDGSLVALAPQTVARLNEGAVFSKDSQGFALGTLREVGKRGITDQVRLVEGAANPVAAGMLLQTMAVQMQLKQIQETLEEINEKLDTLLKSEQFGTIAEVLATGHGVQELNDKVWAGHDLTDADEIKLRDYEDRVRTHLGEAELWLQQLNVLLKLEDPKLKAQYEALDGALRREPVAFWLRVYIVSHVTLGEIRKLRLLRAAAAEPKYARELNEALAAPAPPSAEAVSPSAGTTGTCDDPTSPMVWTSCRSFADCAANSTGHRPVPATIRHRRWSGRAVVPQEGEGSPTAPPTLGGG